MQTIYFQPYCIGKWNDENDTQIKTNGIIMMPTKLSLLQRYDKMIHARQIAIEVLDILLAFPKLRVIVI